MGELIYLGVRLLILLLPLILYGLLKGTSAFTSALVNALAHPHGNFLTKGLAWAAGKVAAGVLIVVNAVEHSLSVALLHSLVPVAHWFRAHATRQLLIQAAMVALTGDIAYGFEHGFGIRVPREIRQKVGHIPKWAGATAATGLIALHEWLKRLSKGIDTLKHETNSSLRAIHRTLTDTIPKEFARVHAREKALAGEVETLDKSFGHALRRLHRLEALFGALAFAGLVAGALAKLGLNWIRCRKVGRVGRQICSVDSDLLDWMLLGALAFNGSISLEQFARDAVLAVEFFVSALGQLLSDLIPVADDYLGGTTGQLPAHFADYLD